MRLPLDGKSEIHNFSRAEGANGRTNEGTMEGTKEAHIKTVNFDSNYKHKQEESKESRSMSSNK